MHTLDRVFFAMSQISNKCEPLSHCHVVAMLIQDNAKTSAIQDGGIWLLRNIFEYEYYILAIVYIHLLDIKKCNM